MAKLYFYYAAMNAGKSTNLLQSAHNYEERNMKTLIFTPKLDDRFGEGKVSSRIGLERDVEKFEGEDDLYVWTAHEHQREKISCVLVDELSNKFEADLLSLREECHIHKGNYCMFTMQYP